MNLVIVSGTREHPRPASHREMFVLLRPHIDRVAVLMHGCANGVDSWADRCWSCTGGPIIRMPARWGDHGQRAGTLRNQAMVEAACAMHACGWNVTALCFPGPRSKGTHDMINRLQWRRGRHTAMYPRPSERWTVHVHEVQTV